MELLLLFSGILSVVLFFLMRARIRSRRVDLFPPAGGAGRGRTAGDRSPLAPNPPAGAAGAELPIPRAPSSIDVKARVIEKAT